ncbi:MAG: hypothetical protein KDE27_21535 [Planctomycetes bacterium]|nr:hypothetical protein [Planctomycetota bacterium]
MSTHSDDPCATARVRGAGLRQARRLLPGARVSRSSNTVRSARSRLAAWRDRVDALTAAVANLEAADRVELEPNVRSLQYRFDRIESRLVTLIRLEVAWSDVGAQLQSGLRELGDAFERAAEALRGCSDRERSVLHRR